MYGIIHESIFNSTVMAEGGDVPYIFMCMITLANGDDVVDYSTAAFATRINKPLEVVEHAIKRLNKEDPESKSTEYGGRRIIPLKEISEAKSNRGWFVVNREEYIELVKKDNRKQTNLRHYRKKKVLKRGNSDSSKTHIDIDVYVDIYKDIKIDNKLWLVWLGVRKKLKAINSDIALKALVRQLVKIHQTGRYTANEAITTAIEKSWRSVTLEWLDNANGNSKKQSRDKNLTGADIAAADLENIH